MINKKGWGFCFVSGMLLAHLYAICVQRLGSMYCVSTFDMESLSGCSDPLEHIHTGGRKCPACVRFGIFCCGIVVRGRDNQRKRQPAHFIPLAIAIPARDLQIPVFEYQYCTLALIPPTKRYRHRLFASFLPSFLHGLYYSVPLLLRVL